MDIYDIMSKIGLKGKKARDILNSNAFKDEVSKLVNEGKTELEAKIQALKIVSPEFTGQVESAVQGVTKEVTDTLDAKQTGSGDAGKSEQNTTTSSDIEQTKGTSDAKVNSAVNESGDTLVSKTTDLPIYNGDDAPASSELVSSTLDTLKKQANSANAKKAGVIVTSALALLGVGAIALKVKNGDKKNIPEMPKISESSDQKVKAGDTLINGKIFAKIAALAQGKNVAEAISLGSSAGLDVNETVDSLNSVFDKPILTIKNNMIFDENGEITAELTNEGIMEI